MSTWPRPPWVTPWEEWRMSMATAISSRGSGRCWHLSGIRSSSGSASHYGAWRTFSHPWPVLIPLCQMVTLRQLLPPETASQNRVAVGFNAGAEVLVGHADLSPLLTFQLTMLDEIPFPPSSPCSNRPVLTLSPPRQWPNGNSSRPWHRSHFIIPRILLLIH